MGDWSITYLLDGTYFIYKQSQEVASGTYDAVTADSYNDQMSSEDREENLTKDLISWMKKIGG